MGRGMCRRARIVAPGLVALLLLLTAGAALADSSWTFQPTPTDLWDLDHYKYYTWGINWTIPADEYISSARIFIDNINDWIVEDNDYLFIHLLDGLSPGVKTYSDNAGVYNNFTGQGVHLTTYSDTNGSAPEDFTYHFTASQIAALTSYSADSKWGLGFDPDCHYFNDGIYMKIDCKTIPEPGTMALMASALGLIGWVKRRRFAA